MESQETYADPSQFLIRLTREQLDGLPWAIVKTNRQGIVTYGNRKMCEIAGLDMIEGRNISDLFDRQNLAVVRERLECRFSGVAEEYEVELTRPGDGVQVPIWVSAMPESDERGNPVGSLAIVRDLLMADVSQEIHRHIEELRAGREILRAVANACQRLVPFDMFGVTLYSVDGEHFRSFYRHPEGELPITLRWWPLTPFGKKLLAERRAINIADLEEWLEQPEWKIYRNEPDVERFLAQGFLSNLSLPVIRGDRVVASVGFSRKRDKGPFTKQDEDRFHQLPLTAAVRMALHYEEADKLKFVLQLIKRIASVSEGTERIAEILVEEIAKYPKYYQWESISIFQPNERDGHIRLLKQKAENRSFLLPEDWHHPINKGVTGQVYHNAKTMNVTNVKDEKYKDMYIEGYPESASELCLPIKVQGKVYWLLNIEDSKRNAFVQEEIQALENIIREVELVLEQATQHQIYIEILKRVQDAVIQTDFQGTIKQINPATEKLLGYSEEDMKGSSLGTYFKDRGQARRVQEADYVPNDEVRLLHKSGSEARVLFSGTSLPREIGLKVYVASDLSTRKRMETLEILRHMYNEIASQTKTSLSLAFTWLDKLQKSTDQPDASDILAKIVKQLNNVDLSYERLLLYERHQTLIPIEKSLFDIPYLLDNIKQRMPVSEAKKIQITVEPDVPPVHGDLYQLSFCVESILSYLLRFVPEEEQIHVTAAQHDTKVVVTIRGYAPEVTGGKITDYAETRWAIRAITEMALGEQIIRRFVEDNHDGTFHSFRGAGARVEYVIELPRA
jgi:PAS domain S-box-containing protein